MEKIYGNSFENLGLSCYLAIYQSVTMSHCSLLLLSNILKKSF